MRPENAANWREFRAGQALEHARVVPELELDDIRLSRERRNVVETFRKCDTRASRFDSVDETPVSGRLQQNESLLHHSG